MLRRLLYKQFPRTRRVAQWFRQRFTAAGMLVCGSLIAAAVFSIDTRRTRAFQVLAILAALLFIAWLLMLFSRRPVLSVERLLPEQATSGQPCHYRIHVTNTGKHPLRDVVIADELDTPLPDYERFLHAPDPPGGAGNRLDRYLGYLRWQHVVRLWRGASLPQVAVPNLPPGGEYTLDIKFTPLRRGWIHFNSMRLARPEPLGLLYKLNRINVPASLLVLPQRYPVPRLRLDGQRRYQAGGLQATASVGDALEFRSLREYRPGDPLRHIHWRSFAKTGYPIVKQYQEEYFARQGLILDTFARDATHEAFEAAVSVAASLLGGPRNPDSLIDLLFMESRAFQLTGGRGLLSMRYLLEVVACIEPRLDNHFEELASHVYRHLPHIGGAVCILLDNDAPRLTLVRKLRAAGITTLALHITESTTDHADDTLVALHPAQLEYGLGRLADIDLNA